MEPEVDERFKPEVREAAAAVYGARWADLTKLGDFENYVYGFAYRGQPAVMRVTHESHRTRPQMEAELHWLKWMRDGGVPFCAAIPTPSGAPVVSVGEGDFHVAAFERAPGAMPKRDELSVELFSSLGRAIGRSHHLAGTYQPNPELPSRLRWDQDAHICEVPRRVPSGESDVLERHQQVMEQLRELPEPADAFGLIHTDLHLANFHWHQGRLLAFDTDDCMYHWFLEDLSTVFYYSVNASFSEQDKRDFYATYFPPFWQSYREEHALDPSWLEHLQLFMRLRCLTLYGLVQVKCPEADRSESQRERFALMRNEIESDTPFTDFDFRAAARA